MHAVVVAKLLLLLTVAIATGAAEIREAQHN